MPYVFEPIGVVRTPFAERVEAPRQTPLAEEAEGRIELFPGHGYEDALEGLEEWERLWVLFVFHRNVEEGRGWKPKVLPPRSTIKRGVFSTRSPHRPNPIGLSAVAIRRVEGLVVHVRALDLLDGTPVLDLKPYVAYADAFPDARAGWLRPGDPGVAWHIEFAEPARARLDWLCERGIDLKPAIEATLALGPQPHAYRRIRPRVGGGPDREPGAMTLAMKEWRIDFAVADRHIRVTLVRSGYRPRQIATEPTLDMHRDFLAAFG